jgi:hypothetical protein
MYVNDMLVKSLKAPEHVTDLRETFDTLRRYKMKLKPSKCVLGFRQENSWVSWCRKGA